MLTQERLKYLFEYSPNTGIFIRNVSVGYRGRHKSGTKCGCISKSSGYAIICIDKTNYYAHRLAWLYMVGEWPKEQTDHINHIRSDNTWDNLRAVTHGENAKNIKKMSTNTSGVTGVTWDKKNKKWQASIYIDRKSKKLGRFLSLKEAAFCRKQAECTLGYHQNHGK